MRRDSPASNGGRGLKQAEGCEGAAQSTTETPQHLWPENWPIWCLWRDIETQWRVGGMGSATGLDYAGVWAVIDRSVHPRKRRTVFWLLQAMEEATLHEWREAHAQRERGRGSGSGR